MLARLQTIITVMLVAAGMAWAVGFSIAGFPALAWVGALVIVFGYALFLGVEFALLYVVQTGDSAPRPTIGQLLLAWWHEVLVAPRVFLWRQPFRSTAEDDFLPDQPNGRRGVLLVHGLVCNRGFWNPWMRALRARGIPFIAVNLEPVFGSIDQYALTIDSAVTRLQTMTGSDVVIVGHSMGGIAIRAWYARSESVARVHRIVTIGSPHRGTWLARYGHTINSREMRLDSPWLAELARRERRAHRERFTCFFGHCDNIVFPAGSGTLDGAQNIHVPGTAHVHMAFQPQVFDEVCRWLR